MFTPQERTAYSYLKHNAEVRPFKIACMTTYECTTWSQSLEIVNAIIKRLHDLGIKRGSMVALRATKCKEVYHLYFALFGIGALTIISDQFKRVDDFIKGTGKEVPLEFAITSENGDWQIINYSTGESNALDFINLPYAEQKVVDDIIKDVDVKEPSILMFTSGSTGVSKGVLLSEYAILNNCLNYVYGYEVSNQKDIQIVLTPLHHIMATIILFTHAIAGTIVFMPAQGSPDYILDSIEKYKITKLDAVPTLFYALIQAQKAKPRDLSSLQSGGIAGGSYSPEQFLYVEEQLGMLLFPTYGMTETATMITHGRRSEPSKVRSDGVGRFTDGVDGVIKNTDGTLTKKGDVGEICVKGYNLMNGYYMDEEANAQAFDSQGYFHTGDLGYLDENDYLHVVGRIKDIIIRGGDNLSPVKIENALVRIEGVEQACVVGVEDSYYGEIVCAAVIAHGVNEEELKVKVSKLLRKSEIPSKIIFLDNMPLNSSGKPDKLHIKKLF